ncbi:Tubulin gamma chain [Ophiocordyceps camponoti-floridani]|uniref:Tubulin gamma chain n=1 Tax=Ophiocordyceps camponoti-floridani TaxID=2030778 RepID=A0A8H4QCQ4_9HYPO|nr:Tubulin gamma chain [Ophiocordyceps camponoti-floridani]
MKQPPEQQTTWHEAGTGILPDSPPGDGPCEGLSTVVASEPASTSGSCFAGTQTEMQTWAETRPVLSSCGSPVKESSETGFPDGGIRAWMVVAGGFLNFMVTFGILNSFGTFQAYYESKWPDLSTSTITWIGSVQLCLFFLGGIFIGPVFDRYGGQKLMFIGTTFCVLSFLGASWSTRYWHYLLSQGFLLGTGSALLFYPTTGAISEWFDGKRGLALGIAVSGSSLGGVFWPILLQVLFNKVSEEVVYRIMAVISTPLLLLSCYLIRARPGHGTAADESLNRQRTVVGTILEPRFISLSVVLMILYAGMLIPFYYIPLYSQERGVDRVMSNHLLSISYGGSFIGRIASGWLADCLGRFNILALIGLLMSFMTLWWIWMQSVSQMVVFAVLFGLFSAGLVPLGSACVAQTTPDMGRIGLRIGVMMAVCSIGALAGGPVSGLLRESTAGWPSVHLFSASLSLLGALLLSAVRLWHQPRLLAKF